MGTWISHLRIAETLLGELPGLDTAAFVIGSLAPDSGVPNADWCAYDPAKETTHFLGPGQGEGRIRDLEFFRKYLSPAKGQDPGQYSFLLGYYTHLLSDNLWSRWIVGASRRDFQAFIAREGMKAWNTMKRD